MNWPEDFTNKIICGDCLEVMKEMPDESIDMAITSPPYWGLRDYGIEQIFGGDGDCEHEWVLKEGKELKLTTGKNSQCVRPWRELATTKMPDSGFCLKCQAWKGQLGLEPTPEMYIEHLTEIFNEVKRVLKKEGTLWLNIGDTYSANRTYQVKQTKCPDESSMGMIAPDNVQPKCLCMIPERLAWSLIQNGWILRNKNIWHKRNSMPSSVKDRFSNRWEYVYCFVKSSKPVYWTNRKTGELVTKQPSGIKGKEGIDWEWKEVGLTWNVRVRDADKERFMQKATKEEKESYGKSKIKKISLWTSHDYYFDLDAVREPHAESSFQRVSQNQGNPKFNGNRQRGHPMGQDTLNPLQFVHPLGKNPGDVFEIATQPFPEAHFAVFPEKLCEKPIKAGCPEEVCKKCGKAKVRISEPEYFSSIHKKGYSTQAGIKHKTAPKESKRISSGIRVEAKWKTIGWTSCNCNAGFEAGIVLDPFVGAGTALFVAKQLRRKFLGIDIKQEYCEMSEKRVAQGVL